MSWPVKPVIREVSARMVSACVTWAVLAAMDDAVSMSMEAAASVTPADMI